MYKNFNITESEKEQILNRLNENGYGQPINEQKTQTRFLLTGSPVFALESNVDRSAQKFCGKLRVGTNRTPSLK